MTDGQRNRITSSVAAIEQVREQILRAARDGKSPAGSGRALTPLPEGALHEIERALTGVAEQVRVIAERFTPEAVRERDAAEPVGSTLYWVSFLTRRMDEEIVEDLTPSQMAKFGTLPPDERELLEHTIVRMRAELAAIRHTMETLRRGG